MSSKLKAIKLSAVLLAGSSMFGFQAADAQSCTTAAWTSVAGSPTAGSPKSSPAVKRYSGACGLAASTAGSYVIESKNHEAEGDLTPFSARFYVYTGVTGGAPLVFRAMDANSGGSAVVQIAYDANDQNFDFTVNGVPKSTTAGSAPRNKWINVGFKYKTGEQFMAKTTTAGTTTQLDATGMTAGASTVEAVQLGMIAANGATGTLYFDEYEASRADAVDPVPAPLCRGDANNDGSINVFDTIQVINERLTSTLVAGQSDCNEDGSVNVFDTICVINLRLASTTCN